MTTAWQWLVAPPLWRGMRIGSIAIPHDGRMLCEITEAQRAQMITHGWVPLPREVIQ